MDVSQWNRLPCLAMFLAASCRSLIIQSFFPYHAHACEICGGQIDNGKGYSARFFFSVFVSQYHYQSDNSLQTFTSLSQTLYTRRLRASLNKTLKRESLLGNGYSTNPKEAISLSHTRQRLPCGSLPFTTCSVTGLTPTPSVSFRLAEAILELNLLLYGYPNNSQI
jgi:hypothetical protein